MNRRKLLRLFPPMALGMLAGLAVSAPVPETFEGEQSDDVQEYPSGFVPDMVVTMQDSAGRDVIGHLFNWRDRDSE